MGVPPAPGDCARNEDFVKSRFCSINSTVILAGLKKIVRYRSYKFVINMVVRYYDRLVLCPRGIHRYPPRCLDHM